MRIKKEMFLDSDEEKEVKQFIQDMIDNPDCDNIASGSMMVTYEKDIDVYEVWLRRGYVTVSKPTKNRKDGDG